MSHTKRFWNFASKCSDTWNISNGQTNVKENLYNHLLSNSYDAWQQYLIVGYSPHNDNYCYLDACCIYSENFHSIETSTQSRNRTIIYAPTPTQEQSASCTNNLDSARGHTTVSNLRKQQWSRIFGKDVFSLAKYRKALEELFRCLVVSHSSCFGLEHSYMRISGPWNFALAGDMVHVIWV